MRNQIIDSIFKKMAVDSTIFFLTADMGINLVERFQVAYPTRYLNVGIAEQSLISICSGLCNTGFRPIAYTISNFLIHRCYEQIRNDVALHNYPITLLGTGAGYDNPPLGPTHHVVDDWGAVRNIPNIDIYTPSSVSYAESLMEKIFSRNRPAYVRIPKGEFAEPASQEDAVFLPGSSESTLLISYGACAQTCLKVQKSDPSVSVLIFNCVRPVNDNHLIEIFAKFQNVITVEDHFPSTGLHCTLSLLWAKHRLQARLLPLGPTAYNLSVGASAPFYYHKDKTDFEGIVETIRSL